MADFVQVDDAGLQVVWEAGAQVQANDAGLLAVYEVANAVTVQDAGLLVVYSTVLASYRVFPLPQAQRLGQSQEGKRVFPV